MPAAAIPPSGPLPATTDVASHMPNIATTTIGLNKTQASMIIGRGGCTINQVRQMTNAKVIVEERPDGNRDLILSGPLDQVEAGLNLVRQVFMTESYDDEKPQQAAQSRYFLRFNLFTKFRIRIFTLQRFQQISSRIHMIIIVELNQFRRKPGGARYVSVRPAWYATDGYAWCNGSNGRNGRTL